MSDFPTSALAALERLSEAIRVRHYSIRTEQAYLYWVKRFLRRARRYPLEDLEASHVRRFLTDLAVKDEVAASTQNQALSALVFFYREVLGFDLADALTDVPRAKRPRRLPVVLTPAEVGRVLTALDGEFWLVGGLLYGSGLRLLEALRLRVKDLDFDYRALLIRDGKGAKDRVVTLPDELSAPLTLHLASRRETHQRDLARGEGTVFLPHALARKYPNAATEWAWQYVFAASSVSTDPRSGERRRHHLDERRVQRAVSRAVRAAGIAKPASCHTIETFLRDTSSRAGRRYPYGAGATRACGRAHDADLYARDPARRPCRGESARSRAGTQWATPSGTEMTRDNTYSAFNRGLGNP